MHNGTKNDLYLLGVDCLVFKNQYAFNSISGIFVDKIMSETLAHVITAPENCSFYVGFYYLYTKLINWETGLSRQP